MPFLCSLSRSSVKLVTEVLRDWISELRFRLSFSNSFLALASSSVFLSNKSFRFSLSNINVLIWLSSVALVNSSSSSLALYSLSQCLSFYSYLVMRFLFSYNWVSSSALQLMISFSLSFLIWFRSTTNFYISLVRSSIIYWSLLIYRFSKSNWFWWEFFNKLNSESLIPSSLSFKLFNSISLMC